MSTKLVLKIIAIIGEVLLVGPYVLRSIAWLVSPPIRVSFALPVSGHVSEVSMNRRQKNQDKRNQKIVAVLDAHPDELLTVPAVADAATELRRRLGLVPAAVKKQRTGRQAKGAIRVKNDLEAPLVKQLMKAANALNLYYRKNQQLDVALALHLRPSEYT